MFLFLCLLCGYVPRFACLVPTSANGIKGDRQDQAVFRERTDRLDRTAPLNRVVRVRVRQWSITRAVRRAVVRSVVRAAVTTCLFNYFFRFLVGQVLVFIRRFPFRVFKREAIHVRIFVINGGVHVCLFKTRTVFLRQVFTNVSIDTSRLVRPTVQT